MNRLLIAIGKIISIMCPHGLRDKLGAVRRYIYTGIWARAFKRFGKRSVICYPVERVRGASSIEIGENTYIERNAELTAWREYGNQRFEPVLRIGNNCMIRHGVQITAINKVIIGDNLLTGPQVVITDNMHGRAVNKEELMIHPLDREVYSKGEVIIGNNVWIGAKAVILPGVHIGDGAVIGANSVVTKDVEPLTVVAGNPARVIRTIK